MNYKTIMDITQVELNGKELIVEYNFIKSELDYFNGTGTFDGIEIKKIFIENVDITNLMYHHFSEIENMILPKHTNI